MAHLPGLSCRAEGQRREVSLIGCHAVKARMRASRIVEAQIAADRSACIADALIGPQVYLLVLDGAPQPLDEHIVPPSAFAIHADGDALLSEDAGEGRAGELRALIGIVNAASNFPKCAEVKFLSWRVSVISRPGGDQGLHFLAAVRGGVANVPGLAR